MKKILKVMLVIMMAVMVTACGGGDNTDRDVYKRQVCICFDCKFGW